MTYASLPPDLKKLVNPSIAMSDAQWKRLGEAWEANRTPVRRKDALDPATAAEVKRLIADNVSVRKIADITGVNRGRIWYIMKRGRTSAKPKVKGKTNTAGKFI